jgi:hypothetical protein
MTPDELERRKALTEKYISRLKDDSAANQWLLDFWLEGNEQNDPALEDELDQEIDAHLARWRDQIDATPPHRFRTTEGELVEVNPHPDAAAVYRLLYLVRLARQAISSHNQRSNLAAATEAGGLIIDEDAG